MRRITSGKIVQKLNKKYDIFQWWKFRDMSLHYSLKSIKKENRIPHVIEDAAVSLENLPKLFLIVNNLNRKYKTKAIAYGHAGNGNIHIHLVLDRKRKSQTKKIATEYFDEIIKLRGTITAEHGDGLARSEFVENQYGIKNYQIFKEIKKMFDPKNVLNPGKIISKKNSIVENLKNF